MKLVLCVAAALFTVLAFTPIVTSTPANAWKKKCYHCFYTTYGKRVCHNDCACYGTH